MPEPLAAVIVIVATIYASAGLIFAFAFVVRGVDVVDPRAARAGWGFRLLILPGSVMFWPLLAMRWLRSIEREK